MNKLTVENLRKVVLRYKSEKKTWSLLNKKEFSGWEKLKAERKKVNALMRKSESEILKIAVYGVECGGCGSEKTMAEIKRGGFVSCCPDRKIQIKGSRK